MPNFGSVGPPEMELVWLSSFFRPGIRDMESPGLEALEPGPEPAEDDEDAPFPSPDAEEAALPSWRSSERRLWRSTSCCLSAKEGKTVALFRDPMCSIIKARLFPRAHQHYAPFSLIKPRRRSILVPQRLTLYRVFKINWLILKMCLAQLLIRILVKLKT